METRIKRYTQLQEKCDHLPAGKLEKPQNQENTDLHNQYKSRYQRHIQDIRMIINQ